MIKKGRLKVYIGASAGVGKSYAMLAAAQARKKAGQDVVIGWIETHGREETEALTAGLERLAPRTVSHRGTSILEFDIDAALKRNPSCILVDELAHTNAPSSRHPKRYLDVYELLDAGIDVDTALNIQHIDSHVPLIEDITKISVRETVPDSVIDRADEVQLVDLPPDLLIERLNAGKIYKGDAAKRALANFFKRENLTALREMALRITADRVDHDLSDILQDGRIEGTWRSNERLMAAVSSSPSSADLIRWTRRSAERLDAPWSVIHIETAEPVSSSDQIQLDQNLNLARELGAEIISVAGVHAADTILREARMRNVTQLVVGKPAFLVRLSRIWNPEDPIMELVRKSNEIDVYFVGGTTNSARAVTAIVRRGWSKITRDLGIALAAAFGLLLGVSALQSFFNYRSLGMLLLGGVAILGLWFGRLSILATAIVTGLGWNFFFIPPRFTFEIQSQEDLVLNLLFLFIASITGFLGYRLRKQEQILRKREFQTSLLLEFTENIAKEATLVGVLNHAVRHLSTAFQCDVVAHTEMAQAAYPAELVFDPSDQSVADWVMKNGREAGAGTKTLADRLWSVLPIQVDQQNLGYFGLKPKVAPLGGKDLTLIRALLHEVAIRIDRERLVRAERENEIALRSQELHVSILNTISHELRTPVAGIVSSVVAVHEEIPVTVRHHLVRAADRLQYVVTSLLTLLRLENSDENPNMEWCDTGDVVRSSIQLAQAGLDESEISDLKIELQSSVDFIFGSERMLCIAVSNLVRNAIQHGEMPISISIQSPSPSSVLISIKNHGEQLSHSILSKVSDPNARWVPAVSGTSKGLGIGIGIVKAFVHLHQGSLSAVSNNGSTEFSIILPQPLRSANAHIDR